PAASTPSPAVPRAVRRPPGTPALRARTGQPGNRTRRRSRCGVAGRRSLARSLATASVPHRGSRARRDDPGIAPDLQARGELQDYAPPVPAGTASGAAATEPEAARLRRGERPLGAQLAR